LRRVWRPALGAVLLAMATGTGALAGQRADPPTKSAWTAGILEYVIPTAGYAYADAWSDGIVPGVVRVSGTVALLWAMADALTGEPGDEPYECGAGCVFGLVATPVGYVWGVTGAVRAAQAWTRENAGLTLGWSPETSSLRVGVRVGF